MGAADGGNGEEGIRGEAGLDGGEGGETTRGSNEISSDGTIIKTESSVGVSAAKVKLSKSGRTRRIVSTASCSIGGSGANGANRVCKAKYRAIDDYKK